MNKSKLIWGVIVIIALIFGGYLWYEGQAQKGKTDQMGNSATSRLSNGDQPEADNSSEDSEAIAEEADIMADENFNASCEAGEWTKLADLTGNETAFPGKLRKVYPDDEASSEFKNYYFYLEGNPSLAVSGKDLSKLDYFEDREVEIQGTLESGGELISAAQIRCSGKETDKDIISKRNSLMGYLADNINSIAPQKAPYKKWVIDIVDFVDENNVYVEYYDTAEDDENSDIDEDTGRRVLLETSPKAGGGYNVKVLAYWEMGEDDFVLKTGTDKFENVDDVNSYQYDPENGTWERID